MSRVTFSLCNFEDKQWKEISSCWFIPSRQRLPELNSPRASIEEFNDENSHYKKILKKNLKENQKSVKKSGVTLNSIIDIPAFKDSKVRKISNNPIKVLDAPFL